MIESRTQKRSLEVRANSAKVFKAENVVALDRILALIYGEKDEPFEVRGKEGLLNSTTQDFRIFDDSQVLSPDGFLFKTKNVDYNALDKTLSSTEKVEAHNEAASKGDSILRLTGIGMKIYVPQKTYEILQNVSAQQRIAKDKGLDIKSQKAVLYPNNGQAVFSKNVLVKNSSLDLRGNRLLIYFQDKRPQRMILDDPDANGKPLHKISAQVQEMKIDCLGLAIEFDEEGGMKKSDAIGNVSAQTKDGVRMRAEKMTMDEVDKRQRILMSGKVEIFVDERHATCQEAEYFPDTGDVVLHKIASVKKGKEILEGDTIRFSTKNNKIFVEKARGQIHRSSIGFGN